MYQIWYPAHNGTNKPFEQRYETLDAAKAKRAVSGDLVVFAGTTNVVPDYSWLWNWEIEDQAYAFRAVRTAELDQLTIGA